MNVKWNLVTGNVWDVRFSLRWIKEYLLSGREALSLARKYRPSRRRYDFHKRQCNNTREVTVSLKTARMSPPKTRGQERRHIIKWLNTSPQILENNKKVYLPDYRLLWYIHIVRNSNWYTGNCLKKKLSNFIF